jgi:hypothetical protein
MGRVLDTTDEGDDVAEDGVGEGDGIGEPKA